MQRQDMRMVEPGGDLYLAEKPVGSERGRQLGVENLDRHGAGVLSILREVNGSHAAAPERALDVVLVGEGFLEAVQHAVGTLSTGIDNLQVGLQSGSCG